MIKRLGWAAIIGTIIALALLLALSGCKRDLYQPDTTMSSTPPNKVIKDCQDAIHAQECLSLLDEGNRHAPATYELYIHGKGSPSQTAKHVKACDQRSQPIPCVLVYRDKKTNEITHYEVIGYNHITTP